MLVRIRKLGSTVTDSASKLPGMLTHVEIGMDANKQYLFQPRGLDPETGLPTKMIILPEARMQGKAEYEDVDLPAGVLGTQVEDKASGYKGMAVAFVVHMSGCIHIAVQPAGRSKDGGTVHQADFDMRRLSGKAIRKPADPVVVKHKGDRVVIPDERKNSQRSHPSPSAVDLAEHTRYDAYASASGMPRMVSEIRPIRV